MSESATTMTLHRGLQLLRAFRAHRAPLTNAELVRRTGLSRSSVSRLTGTLVKLGYLRRISGGTGLELDWSSFDIGNAYAGTSPLTRLANPLLQDLADELEVTVALAVPDQLDMLYIACRSSPHITTLKLHVGSLLPMGLTAIGRAWLWASPPAERERYLASILEAAGADAEALGRRIGQAFAELDDTGVNVVVSEFQPGGCGVAVPVRLGRAGTLMAMNCGIAAMGPELDVDAMRRRLGPALRQAAADLSLRLRDVDVEP